ncbi:MAG: hypothetical protein A2Z15_05495 [Chloroflexi bacterium RBG_16_50_11]|nr:MAG: hypothetical protein A2Z15_05495 [Chloroflexi bacterium RBG_16_50_11]
MDRRSYLRKKAYQRALYQIFIQSACLGIASALMWHFLNILRYGDYYIREPSMFVLVLEMVGLGILIVLLVLNLVQQIKKIKGGGEL